MEPKGYLIDTNVIIDFLSGRFKKPSIEFLEPILSRQPSISIISKIEVLGFNSTPEQEKLLRNFISELYHINITSEVVDMCIEIRKNHRIKLPDALIAATCITSQLTLLTRNTSDFKSIPQIECVNPHNV